MDFQCFRLWSEVISKELLGWYFDFGISFSRDSLVLNFTHKQNQTKAIEFKFIDGQITLFPSKTIPHESKSKKNALIQFRELEHSQLRGVKWNFLDRLIVLDFEGDFSIVVKGYGRFSNVILWQNSTQAVDSIFRLHLKSDWDFNLNEDLKLPIAYVFTDSKQTNITVQWDSLLKLMDDTVVSDSLSGIPNDVERQDLFRSELPSPEIKTNQFIYSSEEVKSQPYLEVLVTEISNSHWKYFIKTVKYDEILNRLINDVDYRRDFTEKIHLRYLVDWILHPVIYGKNRMDEQWEVYQKETSHAISEFFFKKNKESRIGQCKSSVKSLNTHIKQINTRISEIQNRRSFKELGDILISNCHAIKPGVSEPLLFDYYTDQRIRIKINPDLSCAENAERFYKKSKKESIELDVLNKQLDEASHRLFTAETLLDRLESCENHTDLQALKNFELPITSKKAKQSDNFPYKQHFIDGFEIWQGKSSKSNDEMLKLSSKNDLWFHTADFSGSHVIVRKKGKSYPSNVIQFAGKLAALNSKGKNQSLLTVMYTERKFVSKPKGSHPGEVSVIKYDTLDVSLK
jgi:predicted ribosome quality control (RQC) complex YloA/Tae2 family protein